MTQQELESLLDNFRNAPSEDECLEFKKASNDFDSRKLGKYFSALSNEANLRKRKSAWLIFGVKDKPVPREVVGSNYRHSRPSLDSLKSELANKTTNGITFVEIHEVFVDGKRVIMFEVPPSPKGIPLAFEGHYYARNAESLVPLDLHKLESIRNQTKPDWSAEIVEQATIQDLSPSAIKKARDLFSKKNKHLKSEIRTWSDSQLLDKMKLSVGRKITKTAILLLGNPESSSYISPANPVITWILKDKDNIELAFEHFHPPYLLAIDLIYSKIRNLKYRYIKDETLFPEETDMYDPFVIREALNNCIAHQDYSLGGKIILTEHPDRLIFKNNGDFIPESISNVLKRDAPDTQYRNPFLSNAMVQLSMIDTIGSGIKRMFRTQRDKFFPMPDFTIGNHEVVVEVHGIILDLNFARVLAKNIQLSLDDIILLDKVQKKKPLDGTEVKHLKGEKLIEGRKPNFHISLDVAQRTELKKDYLKQKGFNDKYYRDMVVEYLRKYSCASRGDINDLLINKLPDILSQEQKENKIRNLVYSMSKRDHTIINKGSTRKPSWTLKS